MKKALLVLMAASVATSASSQVYHRGYVRSDGTYVAPHYQSRPDSSVYNNWSTRGNVNPYTGQQGTVNPYASPYGSTRPTCYNGICSTLKGF